MGCNCATREKIEKLHAIYGKKVKPDVKTTLSFKIKNFLTHVGAYSIALPLIPILVIYVCYMRFFSKEKKISIRKFLRYKGDKKLDSETIDRIIAGAYINVDNE